MTDSIEEEYVFKCPRCKAAAHACGHWNVCPCGTFNHKALPTCAECGGVLPMAAPDSTVPNGGTVTKLELVEVGEGFRFDTDPGPIRMVPSTAGAKVYCVICMDGDHARDLVHIFSTQEGAQAFADKDTERDHVLYDYVIDCPERMEGSTQ